jgi:sortase (surface protein transpeptidase)
LYINGRGIPYIQGNMSMAAAPANMAATWGGQTLYSNSSGQNTHFIGHNPGVFSGLFSLGIGSQITVTDGAGAARTYTVRRIAQVNDHAVTSSGEDLWGLITGTGGGQRITLQTCITNTENLIVFAY